MTTPPQNLTVAIQDTAALLGWDHPIEVRTAANDLKDRITLMNAISFAMKGWYEGVGPRSGKIKALRELPDAILKEVIAKQEEELRAAEARRQAEEVESTATAFAHFRTSYKQKLREPIVEVTAHGHRFVAREGDISGWTWAHCGART